MSSLPGCVAPDTSPSAPPRSPHLLLAHGDMLHPLTAPNISHVTAPHQSRAFTLSRDFSPHPVSDAVFCTSVKQLHASARILLHSFTFQPVDGALSEILL